MRLRLVLCALVAALLGALPGTTTASAATLQYDAPTVARVDAQQVEADAAGRIALSEAREESASLSVRARGVSTTPVAPVDATNTADDVLRLGTKDSWGNLNILDDHFARHGADFGATSVDDYARQASEFLQQ